MLEEKKEKKTEKLSSIPCRQDASPRLHTTSVSTNDNNIINNIHTRPEETK
jgi:hypothetical protein